MIKGYYQDVFTPWVEKIIKTRECGTVVGFSGSGRSSVIGKAFENLGQDKLFKVLDLDLVSKETVKRKKALKEEIEKGMIEGVKFFLILGLRTDLVSGRRKLKSLYQIRVLMKKSINYIFVPLDDPTLIKKKLLKTGRADILFSNLVYLSFAKGKYFDQLIEQMKNRFDLDISPDQAKKIQCLSGGAPRLVKYISKDFKESGEVRMSETTEGMATIMLKETPLSVLGWLKKKEGEEKIAESLEREGVINKKQGKYGLTSGVLAKALDKFKLGYKLRVDNKKEKLWLKDEEVTSRFSASDRSILFALSKEKRVSREEMARVIYGKKAEKGFSDYAMDQMMSRLRSKIKELGVDEELICTQKRMGYYMKK